MSVGFARDAKVAVVTLNRPQRRNAVDHATLVALREIQAEVAAAAPGEIRVVVLTGEPPAFSAGADLTGVDEADFARELSAVLRGFGALSVPVIAAIDGPALGAGCQLAVAADLRVATAESVIGVPAAKLGLVVDRWTVARIAAELSPPVARAMLLTAQTYTGAQLHASGGVHRVGDLDAAVGWAHEIAELAPLTIAGHKLALERGMADLADDDEVEAARRRAWASNDAREGRTAFMEKRPARFTGT
jgi:enoyl-CoA hydratase